MSDKRSLLQVWLLVLVTAILTCAAIMNFIPEAMYLSYALVSEQLLPIMTMFLQQNQFAQVLIFGSVSASVFHVLRQFYRYMILPIFAGFNSSIIIHNTDKNFNSIIDFISDTLLINDNCANGSLQAVTKPKKKTWKDWLADWNGTAVMSPDVLIYRPDNDQVIHKLQYKGRIIFLERAKSSSPLMGSKRPFTPESVKLSVWGKDNSILKELLQDALAAAIKKEDDDTINIYTITWCWELAMTKKARRKESVILDVDDMEVLLDDARKFLNSGKWYFEMGIPYRRGYLLYGPPGCGKTSFAQVLAGELRLHLCILNLAHQGMTDNELAMYLRDAPLNSIIVLEDVDSIFVERSLSKKDSNAAAVSVSFSGLLNALDGLASQEGRLLFMTTNHIERLDSALIRPGRCDVKLELKLASKLQIERMFLRFFPSETNLAAQFAASLPANELSMATLQGYFLKSPHSAASCLERVNELLHPSVEAVGLTIYEHLHRLGLERYAATLEFCGITTTDELSSSKMEDILPHSAELKYDPEARKLLKTLSSDAEASSKSSLRESYALAEVAAIRDLFMASYSSSIIHSRSSLSSIEDSGESTGVDQKEDNESVDTLVLHSHRSDEDPLSSLSKDFTAALTKDGKGVISMHNLKRLIRMHPDRPVDCIKAIPSFTQKRSLEDRRRGKMDLYRFLKRATLRNEVFNFRREGIINLQDLLLMKSSDCKLLELIKKLADTFKLGKGKAAILAEVLNTVSSDSGNLINFALHPMPSIMDAFILFYCTQELPSGDDINKTCTTDVRSGPMPSSVSQRIEDLAYRFAILCSDSKGNGLVSLLEVDEYLGGYVADPDGAVRNAMVELVNPPFPKELIPTSSVSESSAVGAREWVDDWLASALPQTDLSSYADRFKEQGFHCKADFEIPLLTVKDLEEHMGVGSFAHQRKIVAMHDKLLSEML